MQLTIEQPCPTCGAPIVLGEDDRLIKCGFCDVNNYKVHQKLPRYILPDKLPARTAREDVLYIPYLRFKGSIFLCNEKGVQYKIIDTTRVGAEIESLPVSLGLRPQAMRVRPVTDQVQGKFIRQTVKAEKIFLEAAKLTTFSSQKKKQSFRHRAFIGETLSRVYLPVYRSGNSLFDGVSNIELGDASIIQQSVLDKITFQRSWEPRFLSTICGRCGDAMHGNHGSLVLHCKNCQSQWQEGEGHFEIIEYEVVAPRFEAPRYIPFWFIKPEVSGYALHTMSDFLQLTNQPTVINKNHRKQELLYIIPAFKIKPNVFLNIARNLTLRQTEFDSRNEGKVDDFYPVNLEFKEAVQALKSVTLASAVSQKKLIDILPSLTFEVRSRKLVYLPFRDSGHDMIEHHTGISIPVAALRFGKSL